MKQKGFIFVLAFACLSAAFAAAAPKVAVLDAVLPDKMDPNVAIGVTEKISEELVGSGRFTVLDRTTVGQSLKEIEFQMSGMVSDEQIKKAGEQLNSRLGAAFVVVSRVSQVGETYFVTAKMIDIRTGEITAQASAEQEGKISVTLKIAQAVGKKLAGGVKEPEQAVKTELAEEKPKPAAEKPPAVEKPPAAPKRLHSRISLFGSRPTFSGTSEDAVTSSYPDATFSAAGAGLHWMQFIWKGLYATAFITWANENVDYDIYTDSVLQSFDAQAGVGWGFGFGPNMQLALGLHGGYMNATAGTYWLDEGTAYDGVGYGVEINYDWVILKHLALSARVDLTAGSMGTSITEGYLAFMLGLGWAY
jgi:TolB-like protein